MKETIKSQHELIKPQERQSDVLIKALDKCEKLRTQLNIVLNILLRECPKYEGYVKANFPHYFEELDKWLGKEVG